LYYSNFDASDAHVNNVYLFSDAQAEKKIETRNGMTVKIPNKPKTERREILPIPSKDRGMHEGENSTL
jgi:hypothetical protein